ncbi:hypothetical protein EV192_106417 [Actinocrispum wychmicini]|uniref:Uncharacterized protein n=1 Tax=Actinocrispum wychmicini TaxID=1213861 RepID=A0A4R2JFE4_9PSEU|nr:hypothetical protein EV192_106417 [Actinocrispum wychmicini]
MNGRTTGCGGDSGQEKRDRTDGARGKPAVGGLGRWGGEAECDWAGGGDGLVGDSARWGGGSEGGWVGGWVLLAGGWVRWRGVAGCGWGGGDVSAGGLASPCSARRCGWAGGGNGSLGDLARWGGGDVLVGGLAGLGDVRTRGSIDGGEKDGGEKDGDLGSAMTVGGFGGMWVIGGGVGVIGVRRVVFVGGDAGGLWAAGGWGQVDRGELARCAVGGDHGVLAGGVVFGWGAVGAVRRRARAMSWGNGVMISACPGVR